MPYKSVVLFKYKGFKTWKKTTKKGFSTKTKALSEAREIWQSIPKSTRKIMHHKIKAIKYR